MKRLVYSIACITSVLLFSFNTGISAEAIPGWGKVTDSSGDCDVSVNERSLKISIPGTDHALCVERRQMNAPRVLQEVTGDFVAQVKVSGDFPRGTKGMVSSRLAFQGAGLVLMQDEQNYIRLERAQVVAGTRTTSYANFELRRNGDFEISGGEENLQDKETFLKLERRGEQVFGYISSDGEAWIPLRPMQVKWAKTLQVGVVAGHNTSTPLIAEFKNFVLTKRSEKP